MCCNRIIHSFGYLFMWDARSIVIHRDMACLSANLNYDNVLNLKIRAWMSACRSVVCSVRGLGFFGRCLLFFLFVCETESDRRRGYGYV